MLKRTLALLLGATCLMFVGCTKQSMQSVGGQTNPALADGENDFFKKITISNETEIQSSEIALSQSQNSSVKSFAQHMIDDHKAAEDKVSTVAQEKGVTLPTKLDAAHQGLIDNLRSKTGPDFDEAYADLQVTAHKQTIKLDQAEIDSGLDAQVKALATDLLPTLQMHLGMAQDMKGAL